MTAVPAGDGVVYAVTAHRGVSVTAGGCAEAAIFPFGAFALVALFAVLFVLRLRRNARIRRGIPDALAYWRQGWFCHRRDGTFFPRGALMAAATFRGQVWRAGGYAGLSRGR
ncbi:hypothetical protein BS329_34450 [Amycolatopsis coloradensis]|uniref:Uncharacterized protein n=1 Tax=Amycolatopsis coloradensis TaxID=76021 RepID=A0A1R0KGT0_9PSEU|nr:hypothetical protein [Amycolatopsis coloradensis]OLZ44871.1 hypothetical protein BS329_34450 [Amycolatopsis coloradensis]